MNMTGSGMTLEHGEIQPLILRALVRKLVVKGVLTPDDVQTLLFDAAKESTLAVGNDLSPQAARQMVEEELLPLFLPH